MRPRAFNMKALNDFMTLEMPADKVQVTYVYLGAARNTTHMKCQTLDFEPKSVADVPDWGNGYRLPEGGGGRFWAETILRPVSMYRDPFRRGANKIVLCEVLDMDRTPMHFNTRAPCAAIMDQVKEKHDPWFGIEQEYMLMESTPRGAWPLGWPVDGFPEFGVWYYGHSVGANVAYGRDIVEAHYRACLYAGIPIGGVNSETTPAQWEFQVGPTAGVALADHLWMARHILQRVAEYFGVTVSFDPLPVPRWTGSGAHTNYSTKQTRDLATGMASIEQLVKKLEASHEEHKLVYDLNQGKDNIRRLTDGFANVCKLDPFTSGVGKKNVSVRIPGEVARNGCGYIEDRRPASNADPYAVLAAIVKSTLLS